MFSGSPFKYSSSHFREHQHHDAVVASAVHLESVVRFLAVVCAGFEILTVHVSSDSCVECLTAFRDLPIPTYIIWLRRLNGSF